MSPSSQSPHTSVLKKELLSFFEKIHLKILVDGTAGAGGHAEALLEAHPEIETLVAIDQDHSALVLAQTRLKKWASKTIFIHSNFSKLEEILKKLKIDKIDALLLDLGVSSMQLDQPNRGFSFMYDAPLDMRMDSTQTLTALEIVNGWDERELARIFRDYGEEKKWRLAAQIIGRARKERAIETTKDLVNLLYGPLKSHKKAIHPLTLVFQALRIAVNGELEALKKILPLVIDHLRIGGRCAIISFHSLEDRIVKQLFAKLALDKAQTTGLAGLFQTVIPRVSILTRKPVEASAEEIALNPRSRSAKLRAIEKI